MTPTNKTTPAKAGLAEMKPCPFCGGKPEDHPTFFGMQPQIVCRGCGGRLWGHAEADTIEKWNTRTPASGDASGEDLEAGFDALWHGRSRLAERFEKFSTDNRYSNEWFGNWARANTADIITALASRPHDPPERTEPCPNCNGRTFSHIDVPKHGGGYMPSAVLVRCVNCKAQLLTNDPPEDDDGEAQ